MDFKCGQDLERRRGKRAAFEALRTFVKVEFTACSEGREAGLTMVADWEESEGHRRPSPAEVLQGMKDGYYPARLRWVGRACFGEREGQGGAVPGSRVTSG